MTTKEALYNYIENPETFEVDTLPDMEQVVNAYPYFQTARLLLFKNKFAKGVENMEQELSENAIFCADRVKLFYLVHEEKYARFLQKETAEKNRDNTQTLLDSYLALFSEENPIPETVYNIVSEDYLSYLENHENESLISLETNQEPLKHQDIIDVFLEKADSDERLIVMPAENTIPPDKTSGEEGKDNEFLTETLAKIYIKQKKYEQAITIIKRLSLNFPKKSVYFADQIRFLEYLILNDKNKKQ